MGRKHRKETLTTANTMTVVKGLFSEAVSKHDTEAVKDILNAHRGMLGLNNIENDDLYSPLMTASLEGALEIVSLLVVQGRSDVNLQNRDGQTALMLASYKGHADVVDFLVKNHARTDLVDNMHNTALDLAANEAVRCAILGQPLTTSNPMNEINQQNTDGSSASTDPDAAKTEVPVTIPDQAGYSIQDVFAPVAENELVHNPLQAQSAVDKRAANQSSLREQLATASQSNEELRQQLQEKELNIEQFVAIQSALGEQLSTESQSNDELRKQLRILQDELDIERAQNASHTKELADLQWLVQNLERENEMDHERHQQETHPFCNAECIVC